MGTVANVKGEVASAADESVELSDDGTMYPGPLQLEAAEVAFSFDDNFAHDVHPEA